MTYEPPRPHNHGTGLLDDFSVGEIRVGIDVSQPRLQREHKWTDGDLFRGRHLFGDGEEIVI